MRKQIMGMGWERGKRNWVEWWEGCGLDESGGGEGWESENGQDKRSMEMEGEGRWQRKNGKEWGLQSWKMWYGCYFFQ
jgi:hypothetical protein